MDHHGQLRSIQVQPQLVHQLKLDKCTYVVQIVYKRGYPAGILGIQKHFDRSYTEDILVVFLGSRELGQGP